MKIESKKSSDFYKKHEKTRKMAKNAKNAKNPYFSF